MEDYQIIPSEDGTTIMIQAPFVSRDLVSPLVHITEDFFRKGFEFFFIGTATIEHTFAELAEKDLVTGETIGISVALIILALVFGSVTSAFIPVIMAIVAIFVSIGMVSIVGQVVDLNDFVTNIMTMMVLLLVLIIAYLFYRDIVKKEMLGLKKCKLFLILEVQLDELLCLADLQLYLLF